MIDKTDIELIRRLQENGRYSFSKLAEELNISLSTVSRRINRLIKADIISVRAMANPVELGLRGSALIGLEIDLRKIDAICNKISVNNNVHLLAVTFGRFDLVISVYLPSAEVLLEFIEKELTLDGINRVETIMIGRIVKRSYTIDMDNFIT